MQLLDLTLPTPADNLALDEAILETAEARGRPLEVLRLWESPESAVVVGRSSQIAVEVNQSYCQSYGIPVLRRCSGGASVVIGPGCLMYAVVLSYELRPDLQMIERAHLHVMQTMTSALSRLQPEVRFNGTSDLELRGKKFSGNSLRCKRTHLLYHGTLLYDFPLETIGACLGTPPRQPDYRAGRPHGEFVTNLHVSRASLRAEIISAWQASSPFADWPREMTAKLVAERYSQAEWNSRL